MFKYVRSAVEKGNLVLGYISGLGILLMGLMLFYEVVCRYFLRSPTIWAQEMSIYLFMWTMLAGGAYTLEKGKHVRIDLLVEHFPVRVQRFLEMITSVAALVYCAIITWQAYEMIEASIRLKKLSATPLRVPMWIPQMALFLGFALLTLQFGIIIVDRYNSIFNKCEEGHSC